MNHLQNPIKGWFGHSKPFDFENKYKPADNINKFNAGTPSVLSLIPVNTGLDLVLEAGIMNIRNKSIELGKYLIKIINIELNKLIISINDAEKKDGGEGAILIKLKNLRYLF